MTTTTTPPTCPWCESIKVPRPVWDRVTLFNCGSTPGVQSTDCKLTCYITMAQSQIARLEASLTAAIAAKEQAERERDEAEATIGKAAGELRNKLDAAKEGAEQQFHNLEMQVQHAMEHATSDSKDLLQSAEAEAQSLRERLSAVLTDLSWSQRENGKIMAYSLPAYAYDELQTLLKPQG